MSTLTLAELRDAVQQRADQSNSDFISDDEWNRYINSSIAELRDLLIGAYGEDYFATEADISFSNGSKSQPLPTDFYKMLGVDYVNGVNDNTSLKPYNFHERNDYNNGSHTLGRYQRNYRYRIFGNTIKLVPDAQGSVTLHIFYIPLPVALSDDSDEFDGFNGWEEYVIVRAAIMGVGKEESDTAALNGELAFLKNRIEVMAQNRDAGEVTTIQDVNRQYYRDDLWP